MEEEPPVNTVYSEDTLIDLMAAAWDNGYLSGMEDLLRTDRGDETLTPNPYRNNDDTANEA